MENETRRGWMEHGGHVEEHGGREPSFGMGNSANEANHRLRLSLRIHCTVDGQRSGKEVEKPVTGDGTLWVRGCVHVGAQAKRG